MIVWGGHGNLDRDLNRTTKALEAMSCLTVKVTATIAVKVTIAPENVTTPPPVKAMAAATMKVRAKSC